FSGLRSFAEPAVRFYNKLTLQPFSLRETTEYVCSVFGTTSLDLQRLAEWFHGKTLGHPYFLAFVSRELWRLYRAQQFTDATHLWPVIFHRLEEGKFNADLTVIRKGSCAPACRCADRPERVQPRTARAEISA